jgi:hypothetical protein
MDIRYQPPTAALQIEVARSGSGSLIAMSLGLLLSVGVSVALAFAVTMFYRILLPDVPLTMQEQLPVLMRVSPNSYLFVWMSLVGFGFSALGGNVCARVAHARNYWLGLSLACLTEFCRGRLARSDPLPVFMALAALTIASVLLGTAIGLHRTPT